MTSTTTPSRLRTRLALWLTGVGTASSLLISACSVAAPPSVTVQQAREQASAGQAVLIDVREPDEAAAVRPPGSTLIPLAQLAKRLAELPQDKSTPVLLICRSGNRSSAATDLLQKAGYTQARNVSGGMNAWEQAGLPVQRGAAR
ncbi:MAG: rhodanese-like domain-containing protein [Leptothrix sp. (in: b-proteobacteria)]